MSWPKGKPWNEKRRAAREINPVSAWNKGKQGVSEETRLKMRERKLGKKRPAISRTRECPACDDSFLPNNNRQLYCSGCFSGKHSGRHFRYGLKKQTYEQMLADQRGVCKLCGKVETQHTSGTLRQLSVDHDHDTLVVRGLVCSDCNHRMIGRHTLETARALVRYLEGSFR